MKEVRVNNGWIKLHRELTKWEWYQDGNTMRVFLHLLLTANHKEAKWQGKTIGRGQLITSREHLASDLGLSIQCVRTAISKLKKTENITIKSTNKFTMISVCNYDTYQSEEVEVNQQVNQQLTSKQPATNQQLTTNKNDKNDKNDKIDKNDKNDKNYKSDKNDKNDKKEKNEKNSTIHQVENLEERLIRLLSKSPRRLNLNDSEQKSLAKIIRPIQEHDMELLEYFFALEKSKDCDQTWSRKQSLPTILNNIDHQLDLAHEHKQKSKTSFAVPKPKHIIY